MTVALSDLWRLALAVILAAAIVSSVCARAPRRSVPAGELKRLVACALILYAIGALASVTDHGIVAGTAFGAGISVAALAAWLSRGRDQEDPPGGIEPIDEPPPAQPDGEPRLDWPSFERQFRDYAGRGRSLSRSR